MSGQTRARTIMAVNLYAGGHHPQHLECLRTYWASRRPDADLHFVVSDDYARDHADLLDAVADTPRAHSHVVAAPAIRTNSQGELLSSDRHHGRVVSHWAKRLAADHVLLMYFDHVQLSLAFDLRLRRPLALSGIYFRPTFHYRRLGVEQTRSERLTDIRKQLVLRLALRNPHLRYLFCFDHLAVRDFPRVGGRVRAVALPEPLADTGTSATANGLIADLAESGRKRLLLFGSLDERKGIVPVLEALAGLGLADQRRLALVLAGRVSGGNRDLLLSRIRGFAESSEVQVVLEDRYLDEREIQPLVRACDLVLLTYVRHVGSSGVLVRAARAGVPVLSTDYGLLGVQVQEHRLGATLDVASVPAIRATLERWLTDPGSVGFDESSARAYAAANTAEAFAETIFARVLAEPARETALRPKG